MSALAPQITSQLGLQSFTKVPAPDYRSVRYEAHTVEPIDRLTKGRIGKEFFDAHPAFSPTSIPLACTASFRPSSLGPCSPYTRDETR